ncbi:Modification methylase [Seminavis robusta]|uniref:DNA (cytosine-5-)-methyltransferase n=1 Tax=Seminavis robusta TaxID=568900 RepID=A0A9N8HT89_9STRA|nr:Modification methylase [Seminavis robusta]|eukprot:Sro1483_g276400.1 Modification methylase (714) ;mRNA; r:11542-13866
MNADQQVFEDILDHIPERDQAALQQQNGITDLSKLVDKKGQLQQRQLDGVCSDVQMALHLVCTYLESLDAASTFTWEGLANFSGFVDDSGNYDLDLADETRKKKKQTTEDNDPDGYNLTAKERKQMEQRIGNDPLTMKVRGFSSRSLQFEMDNLDKKKLVEDASEKMQVAFNGSVFYVNKCYYYEQENGESVTVAILKFTRNEQKAIVALVVRFMETCMGPGLEEEPPIGVPATYEEDQTGLPTYVQVREKPGSEPILPLSSLKPCHDPSDKPDLLFEPQQIGQSPHNFGFVYENDGKNRGEEREEIKFLDLFAGAGGYHQGVMQVPGLKGVAAVEYWDTACETFRKNNPETEVYCQKVEDFIEENGPTPSDFRKKHGDMQVVLCSPPCQSFSGSNRDVDHNGEKDLYRKRLSLKFFDAMNTTGALIGVFENVEGMWRRPNIYFLKKIVLDHLLAGYQVRVRLCRAHVFGDPQARPRLIIFVAKKYVEMPNVIETHGPGKHPYVTVGNAFKGLDKTLQKVKDNPDTMAPIPNLEGSMIQKVGDEKDILNADKPAGTIRCGGRAWHPTGNRAITVREAATLQSYPVRYEFAGSLTDQYKQVGNAVPGQMGKAIAMACKESLRFVYDEEIEEFEKAEKVSKADENGQGMDAEDAVGMADEEKTGSVDEDAPMEEVNGTNSSAESHGVSSKTAGMYEAGNSTEGGRMEASVEEAQL